MGWKATAHLISNFAKKLNARLAIIDSMTSHPILDAASGTGRFVSMIRRLIDGAVRSSFEELLRQPLLEIKEAVVGLKVDVAELKEDVTGLKVDVAGLKVDVSGLKEDVAGLKVDVAGLKEDVSGLKEDVAGLKEGFAGLKDGQRRLEANLVETNKQIGALGARLDARIDGLGERLDFRIDGLGGRFDEFAIQQGRVIDEVAGLKGEVASLKRDKESADNLLHRVTRIEDRLFARAS